MMNGRSCLSTAHRLGMAVRVPLFVVCFATSAIILLNGCNSKPGVNASVSRLEKAFAVAPAPAPTEQPTPGQAVRANTYVQFALAAVHSNDYAVAVVMLNNAVRAPGMTPDQFLV